MHPLEVMHLGGALGLGDRHATIRGAVAGAVARSVKLTVQFALLTVGMGAMLFALGTVGQSRFTEATPTNRGNPAANVHIRDGCPAVGEISSALDTRPPDQVVGELTRSMWFRWPIVHELSDRWVENSTVVAYSPCHPDRPIDTHRGNPGVAVVVDPSRAYRVVFVDIP